MIDCSTQNMREFSQSQFINIQMLGDNKRDFVRFLGDNADYLVDVIVWDKQRYVPHMQKNILSSQFEFIVILSEFGATKMIKHGDFHGTISNVIDQTVGVNEYADVHKAVFPIGIVSQLLKINSKARTVLDLFGGTGTTMIAAEQMNVSCFMMELDELYCEIILQRYENYTGEKPILLNRND